MGNSAVSTYLEERAQRQIIYTPVTTSVLDSCIIVFEVIACPRGPAVGFERRSHKLCIEFCQAVRRALKYSVRAYPREINCRREIETEFCLSPDANFDVSGWPSAATS